MSGACVLLEHLPSFRHHDSNEGVLLLILGDGNAFFFPIDEDEESYASTEGGSGIHGDLPPYDATEYQLRLPNDQLHVYSFSFSQSPISSPREIPRKVCLSPDKTLLLMLGAYHEDVKCLLVYQIIPESDELFHLIFYDHSFTFRDACFSPDSRHLTFIPSRYPSFVFRYRLPYVECHHDPNVFPTESDIQPNAHVMGMDHHVNLLPHMLDFEPRCIGPLTIIGPTQGYLGDLFVGSRIVARPFLTGEGCEEYAIWNDEGLGEFCILRLCNAPDADAASPTDDNTPDDDHSSLRSLARAPIVFEWRSFLVDPSVTDAHWLRSGDGAKTYILECGYCGLGPSHGGSGGGGAKEPAGGVVGTGAQGAAARSGTLGMVILRQGYGDRNNDNGIGFCMWKLVSSPAPRKKGRRRKRRSGGGGGGGGGGGSDGGGGGGSAGDGSGGDATGSNATGSNKSPKYLFDVSEKPESSVWYQVSERLDAFKVTCCRWSHTLLLGTKPSFAVVVEGSGLFELVDTCASAFQALNEAFVRTCTAFVQVGPFRRYWVSSDGTLCLFSVSPRVMSKHPEWVHFKNKAKTDLLALRGLGRRIGYFIKPITDDVPPCTLASVYAKSRSKGRARKKGGGGDAHAASERGRHGGGGGDRRRGQTFVGMHLHRCWVCRVTLLKPLQCSRCKAIVYCSRTCQLQHYAEHKQVCVPSLIEHK